MIGNIWNLIIIQPITLTLLWFYDVTGSLGLAIILLTIVIQLVLTPLRLPSLQSAKKLKVVKPKLDELKEKHKEDKMALAQAQMDLYREHGINPLGGILPTLLSIPIIIALYHVLLDTLNNSQNIQTDFLVWNIAKPDPFYLIPILVGISQYFLSDMMLDKTAAKKDPSKPKASDPDEMARIMQGQMKYVFPIMSAVITAGLPVGVGIYWLTSVVFAIIQQHLVNNKD